LTQLDSAVARRRLILGLLAAAATVVIWGSWSAFSRMGAQRLDLPVLVFVRFIIPPLILFPVLLRTGLLPKGVSWPVLAAMVLTGGFGFFIFSILALRLAPVAEVQPLLPGLPPLIVALWVWFAQRLRFTRWQIAGFTLLGFGTAVLVGYPMLTGSGHFALGHLFAIVSATSWAIYVIAFGRSRMGALEAAAVVSTWTALLMLPFCLMPFLAAVEAGQIREIAVQGLVQGVASGVVAIYLFGMAIRLLGPAEASAMAALSPVWAAALAIPMLGEWPSMPAVVAIAAITGGVILANWRTGSPPK
jgi:drug/metabolite transporter (DMT)-like permease